MRSAILVLAVLASPALAEPPPYRDDRSDPAALVASLYNAIGRGEWARAWDYFGEAKPAPDYASFVAGYADTQAVRILLGQVISEGAAGSIYAAVPVALEATARDGTRTIYGGCYITRQLQPALQEPPFRPLTLLRGHLVPRRPPLRTALPERCDPDGQPVF